MLSEIGIELNGRILVYIVIAGGLTELLISFTPKSCSRAKFGALMSLSIALLVAIIDGQVLNLSIWQSLFNGLIAAALASAGFDYLKIVKHLVIKDFK